MQTFKLNFDTGAFLLWAEFIKEYITQKPAGYEMQLEQCIFAELLIRQARNLAFPRPINRLKLRPAEAVALNRVMQKVMAVCDDSSLRQLAYGIIMDIDPKLLSG